MQIGNGNGKARAVLSMPFQITESRGMIALVENCLNNPLLVR